MSRDTRTGGVLELMVLPALYRGGYGFKKQVNIGRRPGGGKHIVDLVATTEEGRSFLVSLKWQQSSGTAEQKVPFEVICLVKAIKDNGVKYHRAYIVLGGDGWKLRDFYVRGGLEEYIIGKDTVKIVTLEGFVSLANRRKL